MQTDYSRATLVANNLGGYGPGPDPTNCSCVRLQGIGMFEGHSVDLFIRVAPDSTYHPIAPGSSCDHSTLLAHSLRIPMQQGTYSDFEITYEFTTTPPPRPGVTPRPPGPLPLENVYLTVMDLERTSPTLGEKEKYVYLSDFTELFTSPTTLIRRSRPMNELPSSNFTEMFVADYFGGSGLAMHDDPTDPNAMSELQRDVSLLARYENQTTIRMRLGTSSGIRCSLFQLSGPSNIYPMCSPPPLLPPMAPPPMAPLPAPPPPQPPVPPRAPCLSGQSISFDFFSSDLAYSNLGGRGPDTFAPSGIRYVNVGSMSAPSGRMVHFDLLVTARSAYTPFDSSSNGLNGRFAQINVASGTSVDLRVRVFPSWRSYGDQLQCSAHRSPGWLLLLWAHGRQRGRVHRPGARGDAPLVRLRADERAHRSAQRS